jgi:hypothetical protein
LKLYKEDGDLLSGPSMFQQLVGNLNYLTITQLNIAFIAQQVIQFMQDLCQTYLIVVHCLFLYLKRTFGNDLLLFYEKSL